jgi:hypothetical protein
LLVSNFPLKNFPWKEPDSSLKLSDAQNCLITKEVFVGVRSIRETVKRFIEKIGTPDNYPLIVDGPVKSGKTITLENIIPSLILQELPRSAFLMLDFSPLSGQPLRFVIVRNFGLT